MIAMTAEEMVTVMAARDILSSRTGEGRGLCETVRDGMNLVIRITDMVSADDPRLQPDSGESPGDVETWVGGIPTAPPKFAGVPFKPKYPTEPKNRAGDVYTGLKGNHPLADEPKGDDPQ